MNTHQKTAYNILVLDDDHAILELVRIILEKDGYHVQTASRVTEALNLIERHGLPHLALVDIMMPYGKNGLEFCQYIHQYCDLPIIMFSARNDSKTIIQAIEKYAEDYITKPFVPGELLARVNRVLRRIGDFAYTLESYTKIDDRLRVDFQNQEILLDNERVSLTPTETKLLYILIRNAGQTVTTLFILQRMWPLESAQEDRLRVHIHRLRRKLGKKCNNDDYIQSTRGVGYCFAK